MKNARLIRNLKGRFLSGAEGVVTGMLILASSPVLGQQFNSDSYISKPHGMATVILTSGQRNTMFMNTFSLLPRWEFTVAAYIYRSDEHRLTDDGYSLSFYAKYMFYENEAKTGGFAMKAGKGLDPGYLDGENKIKEASETYWTNVPVTLPFFNNTLSWDLMPGASITMRDGEGEINTWAFTYSTRLAYYPFNMEWAAVGEVFGSEGNVTSTPEYRAGIRWEPNIHTNIALTYGSKLDGANGAGFEVGIMLFSPPFFCIGGCK